jgi:hypothetical protein
MAWQLPTIIRLFLEHRKEVAVEMNGQAKSHMDTVDKILSANSTQSKEMLEKFDKRFESVEDSIQKLFELQCRNQEIIKDTLELLKHKDQ